MTPIERARDRHRLTAVAGRTGIHVPSSTGSTVTVRCPFPSHGHPDRTPSLRLYLDDDRFYCFGCAAKGDVIQWACDTERVGVVGAIAILDSGRILTNAWAGQSDLRGAAAPRPLGPGAPAERPDVARTPVDRVLVTLDAGRILTNAWAGELDVRGAATPRPLGPGAPAERPDVARTPVDRVLVTLDAAWGHCIAPPLHDHAAAYLAGRGIDIAVLEAHTGRSETGHTPPRPDGLVAALRADGFSDDELVDAGLARRYPDGSFRDFYRQRVFIPVRDDQQRIVGLVGRNVGDQARWSKYTNPPLTAVYDKSVNLYQPLPAPIHPAGRVVVVEGTLDALAIAVAGIRIGRADRYCPLTQSGRELSDAQIRHIAALHPAPAVLAFDADPAGHDSTRRYQAAFAAIGFPVTVVKLPDGYDPASWLVAAGPDALVDLVSPNSAAHANRQRAQRDVSSGRISDSASECTSLTIGL
jgi:DNA primase